MANKPYYGVNPAYSPQQADSMLSELYPAMAQATKTGLGNVRTGLGNVWNSMDNTSKAATVVGLVPGIGQVGDFAGLADDARLFYQNPEMRTPANFGLSALGALPLMPSMGMVKGMGKGIAGSIVPPVDVVKSIKPKPIKAPASDVGFYSPVEKAALNLNRNQGSGQSFLNDLKKGDNVKGDELTYTELEDWLKTKPNLTKQEVQDYIANNKLNVKEVVLGGADKIRNISEIDQDLNILFEEVRLKNPDKVLTQMEIDKYPEIKAKIDLLVEEGDVARKNSFTKRDTTKYAKYQLPNGDNYKEILLTLPSKPMEISKAAELHYKTFVMRGGDPSWNQLSPARQQEITNAMDNEARNVSETPDYSSSHWDEPNVLAHIRTNERLDTSGRKTTLIEEVQSDWHQAGREKGYNNTVKKITPEEKKEWRELDAMGVGVRTNVQEERLEELDYLVAGSMKGAPDAPFKEDWYKLALKRAIKEAVDNGSDSISLTTGSRQAERYDLSKQINTLRAEKIIDGQKAGQYEINAIDKDGRTTIYKVVTEGELENTIGKDLAKKIVEDAPKYPDGKEYSGIDLIVGGEGMKKYYDEIYPAFLNKFGKKYGVKVEDNIIDIGTPEKVYTLPITPQMREDVLKGQPLTDKNEQDKNQYYA